MFIATVDDQHFVKPNTPHRKLVYRQVTLSAGRDTQRYM